MRTPRGVARYEYDQAGRLVRKNLPKGVTVDYYHDRDGRLVETRFSTGLVRTRHYERNGKLSHIVGSDGYTLTVKGSGKTRSVVVTGPKQYSADIARIHRKGQSAYAAMIGRMRPGALLMQADGDGGCTFNWWGNLECDLAGGSYDDSWGAGDWGGGGDGDGDGWSGGVVDEWGGDVGAGEYGDDAGYESGHDTGVEAGGGDHGDSGSGHWDGWGAGNNGAGDPGSPGNNAYMQCMAVSCERQNQDFREFCSREPAKDQEMCYRYTAKYYFKCERECWYKSY